MPYNTNERVARKAHVNPKVSIGTVNGILLSRPPADGPRIALSPA
jgi:hypothetical protein